MSTTRTTPPPSPRLATAVLLLLAALAPGCSEPVGRGGSSGPRLDAAAEDPVAFGSVGPFELTDQDGRAVGLDDLRGRPWIMGALFTTCTTLCPQMSAGMARVAGALADTDVRLVSLSVDPAYDTPEVLAEYAEVLGADTERWWFLTGDEDEIHALVRSSFHLPVERSTDPDVELGLQVTHDPRLVAVDAEGRVRGYYDSRSDEALAKLEQRIRALAAGTP